VVAGDGYKVRYLEGWAKKRLGELIHIKHGYAFKGEYFSDAGPFVVLTPGNFYDEGGFKTKGANEKFYTGEVPKEFMLSKGDLLVAMTEQAEGLLGSSAIVPADDFYLHNQRLGLVTELDTEQVDRRFIYYLFNTREVRQHIRASASGTKVRHTSPSRIYELVVSLPPISVQRKIAAILSAYDELIENNTRRIKILEEIAQSLYREWFVHFRFPGNEKFPFLDSPIGKVPEGWLSSYPDYVDFLEGPGLRNWQYRNEGIPFLNIRTLVSNDIDSSKLQHVDEQEVRQRYSHFLLQPYDHIVSSSGTIGRIVTIQKRHLPLMLNTSVIRMRPKKKAIDKWQLKHFLQSNYFQHQIRAQASGVAQANYGPSHLKTMWILAPTEDIGQAYESLVSPLEELICQLVNKNFNLRRTRELMLPKLMSGDSSC
jgi:type I restriction enzyme, S subunit